MQSLPHQRAKVVSFLHRKPKLLIIGHARHGKDTLAEKIRDRMDLAFTSSSVLSDRNVFGLRGAATATTLLRKCLRIESIIEKHGQT
jgi:hypothetical protein